MKSAVQGERRGGEQREGERRGQLSRQNGFHHSVHIAPLIRLLHAGEEAAAPLALISGPDLLQ